MGDLRRHPRRTRPGLTTSCCRAKSTWLSATFTVQLALPGPGYPSSSPSATSLQGHSETASLPGFSDLSQVPYSGCSPTASSFGFPVVAQAP